MGMYALVVALGMLFAASVVGYLAIRSMHQPWPPPGFPVLPRTLWLSTLAIVAASVAIQRAVAAAGRADGSAARRNLLFTLALGLVFLALQSAAWMQVVRQIEVSGATGPYVKLFYVLTGLHAVHVLGGLGPLALVVRRAMAGPCDARCSAGIRYSAIYWHFLDAVWCVLFAVIYLI
jgi:heme/copper-type cytochrome/quinol oxidase subunit 3